MAHGMRPTLIALPCLSEVVLIGVTVPPVICARPPFVNHVRGLPVRGNRDSSRIDSDLDGLACLVGGGVDRRGGVRAPVGHVTRPPVRGYRPPPPLLPA